MDKRKIKAIIFDLGNVLVDFDHLRAVEKISKFCNKNPNDIFNLFFDSNLTGLFEEGKITPKEFFLKVKEILNAKLDYEKFCLIWNNIFFLTKKNCIVYKLAKKLKKHYKVALLSNINVLHLNYLKRNFPVFDAFHNVIASCEVGKRKPHPAIYKRTLDILRVLPENTFYTDDRADLIERANRLGIRSFVFKNIKQLKSDLLSSGIDIS